MSEFQWKYVREIFRNCTIISNIKYFKSHVRGKIVLRNLSLRALYEYMYMPAYNRVFINWTFLGDFLQNVGLKKKRLIIFQKELFYEKIDSEFLHIFYHTLHKIYIII